MIRRIRIQGFKSFEDVEVHLQPLTVLIGPNGSGKSNLLDALLLLSRIGSGMPVSQAFAPPFRGTALECLRYEQESLVFSIEVDTAIPPSMMDARFKPTKLDGALLRRLMESGLPIPKRYPSVRYRLEVEVSQRTGESVIRDEEIIALTKSLQPHKSVRKFVRSTFLNELASGDKENIIPHEKVAQKSLIPASLRSSIDMSPIEWAFGTWQILYFEPRVFMRQPHPPTGSSQVGFYGEHLADYLLNLKETNPKQFKSLENSLRYFVPGVEGIEVEINRKRGEVDLTLREKGGSISSRLISDGTLRILGLLAACTVDPPPSLIAIEEPENGIHPRGLRAIAELLEVVAESGDTQVIVTTHSPFFADLVPKKALYICTKDGEKSIIEPVSARGPLGHRRVVQQVLDQKKPDDSYGETPMSLRILRGDFDA